jgi:hypothetical protein
MLNIFFIFAGSHLFGQTFEACDLNRLLEKHPLMKQFDKKTNRFKNTKSAIKDINELTQERKSLQSKIKKLELKKSKLVAASLTTSETNTSGNNLWQKIKKIDEKITEFKNKLPEIKELIDTGGVPPITTVLPIARRIVKETIQELKPGANKIIINKLPRFYLPAPDFKQNLLRKFFYNPHKTSRLTEYLKQINRTSLLFKEVSKPVFVIERKK